MKKLLLSFILCFSFFSFSFAQEVSKLISDFENNEDVQRQILDKEILQLSIETAISADPTGAVAAQIPPYMKKLDMIEIMDLTGCQPDIKTSFTERLSSIKNDSEYEILSIENENEDNDLIRIMVKRNEDQLKEIIVFGIDKEENEIAIVRMKGSLDNSDIAEILKKPTIK